MKSVVFLRDWRSVIVVVLNIPFALVAALVALWLAGETINLMTLGGLALAVGILVDESTVAVENVHVQMERTPSVALAAWRGVTETAVPRLLAMLCILAVFIPAFVMEGAARGLFLPLALAVGFSMIASYILSSTFVPVLCVWLLRNKHHGPGDSPAPGFYSRTIGGLGRILTSDRYSVYKCWPNQKRQICWAHLLRDFLAVKEDRNAWSWLGNDLVEEGLRMLKLWKKVRIGTMARKTYSRRLNAPIHRNSTDKSSGFI